MAGKITDDDENDNNNNFAANRRTKYNEKNMKTSTILN